MTERDWLGTLFAEIAKIERDLCPKVCAMGAERVHGHDGTTMLRLWYMRSEAKVLADRLGIKYKYFSPVSEQPEVHRAGDSNPAGSVHVDSWKIAASRRGPPPPAPRPPPQCGFTSP